MPASCPEKRRRAAGCGCRAACRGLMRPMRAPA
jgi:hypothetical protein